jgi:hypothetical protein
MQQPAAASLYVKLHPTPETGLAAGVNRIAVVGRRWSRHTTTFAKAHRKQPSYARTCEGAAYAYIQSNSQTQRL